MLNLTTKLQQAKAKLDASRGISYASEIVPDSRRGPLSETLLGRGLFGVSEWIHYDSHEGNRTGPRLPIVPNRATAGSRQASVLELVSMFLDDALHSGLDLLAELIKLYTWVQAIGTLMGNQAAQLGGSACLWQVALLHVSVGVLLHKGYLAVRMVGIQVLL